LDTDLALTLGFVLGAFSIPALVSAYSDGRVPRAFMVLLLLAGMLVLYAVVVQPGGYRFSQLPVVFFGVFARFMP